MRRVIGIGLDGGSIELIDALLPSGALPNFARLREASVRVPLRDELAYRHGMVWPQFVSGSEARLEGDWQRLTFDRDTYEGFQESARHEIEGVPPFWERVGARTITFDVPRTTVRGPGVHVTAWGAHAPLHARASEPSGLLRDIDARFGVHPGFANDHACGWHDPRRLDRTVDALVVGAHRRAEIVVDLMDRFSDWEFVLCTMSEAHSASEFLWHAMVPDHPLADYDPGAQAQLERVFRAIDDAVGHIIDHAPDGATVVVFALDGMRSGHGDLPSIVLLPELMHRREFGAGLLRDEDVAAWKAAGCPPIVPRLGQPWRHDLDARMTQPQRRRWTERTSAYQSARLTRPGRKLLERIKHAPLGALGVPIPPESNATAEVLFADRESADGLLFIDNYRAYRPSMRSFALPSFGDGYVRVNLEGRDRSGVVAADDYEQECQAIAELIGECRDVRTGEPVASKIVLLGAEDPADRDGHRYADLIVEWARPIDAIEHPDLGVVGPFPLHRTGAHSGSGFAWIRGDGLVPTDVEEHSVLDLAPTIARLLDPEAALPPGGAPIVELSMR